VLAVTDLQVAYGHALALSGVTLRVNPGEMVFVVGRNGAGKTTLLKTICGLLQPRGGDIKLDGETTVGKPTEQLAREGISYVAQDKKVFSDLSVSDNIALAAHAAGKDLKDGVAKVLSLYPKMEQFLGSKAGALSGGQREILLIGRALVSEPRLLMVDEPTEGLAAVVINDIFEILTRMKENTAAIIVEQNLRVVSKLADRVYLMKEGKVIKEIADPDQIADIASLEEQL
jgi:ABC-type branched-subunit amino acid transport system ATPase component